MSQMAKDTIDMMESLPQQDQVLVYELVKRMVQAWDPDFTKATSQEAERIRQAETEISNGEYINFNDIA